MRVLAALRTLDLISRALDRPVRPRAAAVRREPSTRSELAAAAGTQGGLIVSFALSSRIPSGTSTRAHTDTALRSSIPRRSALSLRAGLAAAPQRTPRNRTGTNHCWHWTSRSWSFLSWHLSAHVSCEARCRALQGRRSRAADITVRQRRGSRNRDRCRAMLHGSLDGTRGSDGGGERQTSSFDSSVSESIRGGVGDSASHLCVRRIGR